MGAPAEGADDMAEDFYGSEGGVEHGAAQSVEDHIKAAACGVLGDDLLGMVHQDEGVAEAAACQLTVLDYAPESAAANDITAIAQRIHASLAPG